MFKKIKVYNPEAIVKKCHTLSHNQFLFGVFFNVVIFFLNQKHSFLTINIPILVNLK